MRIASVLSKGYPFRLGGPPVFAGGAQITTMSFLRALTARRGHRCVLLTLFPIRQHARCDGVSIIGCRDLEELRRTLEASRPDVVIAGSGLSLHAVRYAAGMGVPSFLYHHAYECSALTQDQQLSWGLSGAGDHLGAEESDFLATRADRIAACSSFLRKHVRSTGRLCHQVIYPEFDRARMVMPEFRPPPGGFITGVCGHGYKGAEIFLGLAQRFPGERFQVCGNIDPAQRSRFEAQANITIVPAATTKRMLRTSRIVLVPSQWPEPFGRTAVEAMANGIPVLVSATGGLMEAAPDPVLQVQDFQDIAAWRQRLEELLIDRTARGQNSACGRRLAEPFLSGRSTAVLERELRALAGRRRARRASRRLVALCGEREAKTAYALVNARWLAAGRDLARVKLAPLERPSDFCPEPVDVFVHHDYQQDFRTVQVPEEGRFVAVRTWDFGGFPPAWVAKVNAECDQLWVYSRSVRESAIRSGIPPGRVRVLPLGFDDRVFRPNGSLYPLPTGKSFRFLFTGRTVIRKGIDILLKAYASAFRPQDDVCLVVKDNPRDVFYAGIDFRSRILEMARDPETPEIVYLGEFLTVEELAALYRTCQAGVFPYRAEGFCLPILEAMACGLPCVVPRFGACLDYCDDENSVLVPARRISLPVTGDYAINTLGFREEIRDVDFCEIPAETLAARMREVFQSGPASLARKGRAAAKLAHSRFRWVDSVARMAELLLELERPGTPVRLDQKRRLHREHARTFRHARELFLGREE